MAASGATLNSFTYVITGPGGFSRQDTVSIANSDKIATNVGGLPVGTGYSISITTSSVDGALTCAGSSTFDIAAKATTSVTVQLACREAPRNGSAVVGATLNQCPLIDGINAAPQSVRVGSQLALSAAAHDSDAGPSPLTYQWTATSGTFNSAASKTPQFTCVAAGDVVVSLSVSDGNCSDTLTVSVNCTAPGESGVARVVVNEVESNGGVPGDWVELYNSGNASADISGWKFKDNDDSHAFYNVPAGTTLAAGAYYVLEEAQFGFGLGAADSARLWDAAGTPIDSYSWTAHAAITYGRCPNGTGAFVATSSTKGAANDCGSSGGSGGASGTGGASAGGSTSAGGAGGAVAGSTGTGGSAAGSTGAGGATSGGSGSGGVGGAGGASGAAGGGGTSGASATDWPGTAAVVTVDELNYFGTNLSGLNYQPATATEPAVLWAAQNSPSKLFRLLWNGVSWVPDTANGWSAGKLLHYTSGTGAPDSEGLTKSDWLGSSMYVSTERDNNNNSVSRLSILRFDTSAASGELTALNDWNLNSDLPVVGSNLGLEAITFVPDAALVAGGFFDEATHAVYNPANYANHGGGLFFVGVEGNGIIYAYALDHASNAFVRVATLPSGQVSIMDLAYDRETNYLWGYCDNTCGNKATVFRLDTGAGSPTQGRFQVSRVFSRPSSLPDSNNEGISFAPEAECSGGQKAFFWSDDDQKDGHAIRRGSIPCGTFF